MPSLQLRMLYGLAAIGIIYVTATSGLAITGGDPVRQRSRCPFIRNSLLNGRVRIRSRGRIAKFSCNNGYELVGRRFATCVRGEWNNPIPICVTNGCPVISSPENGQMNLLISDALVTFSCESGYVLSGSRTVYCNGISWNDTIPTCNRHGCPVLNNPAVGKMNLQTSGLLATFSCNPGYILMGSSTMYCIGDFWNDTIPICNVATTSPELTCDFEDSNICGWTNDKYNNFDWKRYQASTPLNPWRSSPSYDHTLGTKDKGYYMCVPLSALETKPNDIASLLSPVYFPKSTPGCFTFWYNMFGYSIGSLRVYLKKESQLPKDLHPVWERNGHQGNLWLQGAISIPELYENFQIVIEEVKANGIGHISIDDVMLYTTSCEELVVENITRDADSCKLRCHSDSDINSTCSCKLDCTTKKTCCDDYEYFCLATVERTDVGLFSIKPPTRTISTSGEYLHSSIETEAITTEQTITFSRISSSNASETTFLTSLEEDFSKTSNQNTLITNTSSVSVITTPDDTKEITSVTNIPIQNLTFNRMPTSIPSSIANTKSSVATSKLLNTVESRRTAMPTFKVTTPNKQSFAGARSTTNVVVTSHSSTKLSTESSDVQTKLTSPSAKTSFAETKKPLVTKMKPTPSISLPVVKNTSSTTSSIPTSSSVYTVIRSTTSKRTVAPTIATSASSFKASMKTPITVATQRSKYLSSPTLPIRTTSKSAKTTLAKPSTFTTNKFNSVNRYSKEPSTRKPYWSTKTLPVTARILSTTNYRNKEKSKAAYLTSTARRRKYTIPVRSTTPSGVFNTKTTYWFSSQNRSEIYVGSRKSSLSEPLHTVSFTPSTEYYKTATQHKPLLCGRLGIPDSLCTPRWQTKSSQIIVATRSTKEMNSISYAQKSLFFTKGTKVTTTLNNPTSLGIPTAFTQLISSISEQSSSSISETTTSVPNSASYQWTDMLDTWTPDYKLRTKYRTYHSQPSDKPAISTTVIVAITLSSVSALVLIILMSMYLRCRKRKVVQSKLSDDSEMRFLSDSEIVEFVEASSKLFTEPNSLNNYDI